MILELLIKCSVRES